MASAGPKEKEEKEEGPRSTEGTQKEMASAGPQKEKEEKEGKREREEDIKSKI